MDTIFKEDLQKLKNLINFEWKKWSDYSKKCQTFKNLCKVNDAMIIYSKAQDEKQFRTVHYLLKTYKIISLEMIKKCFNKIGTSEEKQSDLNDKQFEAIDLWFTILQKIENYYRKVYPDLYKHDEKTPTISKERFLEIFGSK